MTQVDAEIPACSHRETCRLCDGRRLELILSLTPTPPGDHYVTIDELNQSQPTYPLDLVLCADCGLAQLADTVDPALIYPAYRYRTAISLGLAHHFERYASSVITRYHPRAGSLIVDIGSNDGTLLEVFRRRGFRVLGCDPAVEIATAASVDGLTTLPKFFSHTVAKDLCDSVGRASIITANHVFANVSDCHDFIEGVRTLLAPDGVFVLETGYFPDLMTSRLIDTIEHEHLCYLSIQSLTCFLERHGLWMRGAEHSSVKGGSIRCYIQHSGTRKFTASDSSSPFSFMRSAEEARIASAESLRSFAACVEAIRSEMRALVNLLARHHRRVAGYGAAVGSTALLYHFDLGRIIQFLVDDNPIRQGLFSPGLHLPVKPSSSLNDYDIDDVIVLAWRYADPIIAHHQAFRDRGGCFIVPLPTVQVLAPRRELPALYAEFVGAQ